jgi:hypothetical protein
LKPTFVLFAVLLSTLAAGCGGGGSSEQTTTAAKAAPNERFTTAEWEQYKTDAAAFQTLNDKTLAKVTACTKPINPPAGAMAKCVGDSLTNLSAATEKLGQTLDGLTSSGRRSLPDGAQRPAQLRQALPGLDRVAAKRDRRRQLRGCVQRGQQHEDRADGRTSGEGPSHEGLRSGLDGLPLTARRGRTPRRPRT